MKTKFLNLAILFTLSLFLTGCNQNKLKHANNENEMLKKVLEETRDLNSQINTTNRQEVYCSSTEAVDVKKSYYDTRDGKASLVFIVPEGHELEEITEKRDNRNNRIYFKCTGETYSDNTQVKKIAVEGFKKEEKEKLYVYLTHVYNSNECEINIRTRHKGSVVQGQPVVKVQPVVQ